MLSAHSGPISALCVSPATRHLISAGGDGAVHVWRAAARGGELPALVASYAGSYAAGGAATGTATKGYAGGSAGAPIAGRGGGRAGGRGGGKGGRASTAIGGRGQPARPASAASTAAAAAAATTVGWSGDPRPSSVHSDPPRCALSGVRSLTIAHTSSRLAAMANAAAAQGLPRLFAVRRTARQSDQSPRTIPKDLYLVPSLTPPQPSPHPILHSPSPHPLTPLTLTTPSHSYSPPSPLRSHPTLTNLPLSLPGHHRRLNLFPRGA